MGCGVQRSSCSEFGEAVLHWSFGDNEGPVLLRMRDLGVIVCQRLYDRMGPSQLILKA